MSELSEELELESSELLEELELEPSESESGVDGWSLGDEYLDTDDLDEGASEGGGMDDLGAEGSAEKSRSGKGDLDAGSDLENYKSEHFDKCYEQILTVVLPDLAHSVLLNADYTLLRPVKAKLEKAVALAELLAALDAHAPPHVAALVEVSDDLTPLFAMLVAAPP